MIECGRTGVDRGSAGRAGCPQHWLPAACATAPATNGVDRWIIRCACCRVLEGALIAVGPRAPHAVADHEHLLVSADGSRFAAHTAVPRGAGSGPRVGVVVLPDVRGLARSSDGSPSASPATGPRPPRSTGTAGRTAGPDVGAARPASPA